MSNAFDFELIADDRVSATIDEINEAIKNLLPHLDETQEKLNLGGDETVDSWMMSAVGWIKWPVVHGITSSSSEISFLH
jgi:CRISPR/Cas system CMR subunit Cmr4 (Cas7 group RAMP superfamily)